MSLLLVGMKDGRTFCQSCSISTDPGRLQFHCHPPGEQAPNPCECSADYDRDVLKVELTEIMSRWPVEGVDYTFDDSGKLVNLRSGPDN